MDFQQMRNLIAGCTDPSSTEIPDPKLAVQLRAHPSSIVMKYQIHDQHELADWFAHTVDANGHAKCQIMGNVMLSPEQQAMTKAGRAMAIGVVAVFDEMMAAAERGKSIEEKGKFKELRHWVGIVQFLQLEYSQGIRTFAELKRSFEQKRSPIFQETYEGFIAAVDVMAVDQQDLELKSAINKPNTNIQVIISKISGNIKQYLSDNKVALLEFFNDRPLAEDTENYRMVVQVIDWVLTPAYNLDVAQANNDLKQLKAGAVSLPAIPAFLTGEVDAFNLAWLNTHGTLVSHYGSPILAAAVQHEETREQHQLWTGDSLKLRLAELGRKQEDVHEAALRALLLDNGVSQDLFEAFTPQYQQQLIGNFKSQLLQDPKIPPVLSEQDFIAISTKDPRIFRSGQQ